MIMEGRNVGTMLASPVQGLARAKNLTTELPKVHESPPPTID